MKKEMLMKREDQKTKGKDEKYQGKSEASRKEERWSKPRNESIGKPLQEAILSLLARVAPVGRMNMRATPGLDKMTCIP